MKRFRVEPGPGWRDSWLIAKFFYAINIEEATVLAKRYFGDYMKFFIKEEV